jgi:hypothetical protein
MSNLVYAIKGDKVPAAFDGLKEKRVAVVAVSDASSFQDDPTMRMLSRHFSEILQTQVKDIQLIAEEEIDKWRDQHGWEAADFVALGKGVNADHLIAIEVAGLKLRDGATMYRGRAAVTTSVFEIATGRRVFRRHEEEYTYPVSAGQVTTETTEARFRRTFISMLAQHLARYFYAYDFQDTFALDAKIASS